MLQRLLAAARAVAVRKVDSDESDSCTVAEDINQNDKNFDPALPSFDLQDFDFDKFLLELQVQGAMPITPNLLSSENIFE